MTVLPITQPVGGGPWYAFWGPIVAIATNGSGYSSEISPVTDDWTFGDGFEAAPQDRARKSPAFQTGSKKSPARSGAVLEEATWLQLTGMEPDDKRPAENSSCKRA